MALSIQLPYSKSIGARFLVASYFADTLRECPPFNDCDDLRVIQKALLSLSTAKSGDATSPAALDIHASGTAFRFVTAAAASSPGADFIVTGTPRLCARPMAPMLEVLRQAGAGITALGEGATGPYHVLGDSLQGGDFEIRGDVSSQFISALMLSAPAWSKGMRLRFTTPLVSRPYAEMTARVMEKFGIDMRFSDDGVEVAHGSYMSPGGFRVEADWSAAGFFYEAAVFSSESIRIEGLTPPSESLQGDSATARFFTALGVESDFDADGVKLCRTQPLPELVEADLTDNPDLAPAFAVACAGNGVPFCFSGVRNLRLKECDRLEAISRELGKLGFVVEVTDDTIGWRGERVEPADDLIETYDDHRIAMAFAPMALATGRIRIAAPDVVDKSFEDFWNQIPKIGLTCRRSGDVMIVEAL